MRSGARRVAILLITASGACALFPSLAGFDDGGTDASIPDVAAERDASVDAPGDAPGDVHHDVAETSTLGFDAGPAPDAAALLCGAHWCLVGPEVCCVNLNVSNPSCAPVDSGCPDADVTMACDDPNDCTLLGFPGTYCCVNELPSDVGKSVQCQSTCVVQSGTSTRLCDPNDASICSGTSCAISTATLPGIYICK